MKKLISLLLACAMLFGCASFAEEAAPAEKVTNFEVIAADETTGQIQLSYIPELTNILDVDGLKFKDMNGNGELDAYEDWRNDVAARVADIMNQMTTQEKSMLLYQPCTGNNNAGIEYNDYTLYDAENPNSMYTLIVVQGITHFLDNSNGTPDEQVWAHNETQKLAEATRLSIPVTITCDRQYNAWGGYIDTPHDAFGTAADPELGAKLWEMYSAETKAVGYHVVFQPYGVEIGSFNGEDPAYIYEMTLAEVAAIQKGGSQACVKHFITRGGDSSFEAAHSVAWNVENFLYPWKAAIEAGCQWIMTNSYNKGLEGKMTVDYDGVTLKYLREEMGYDGILLTDWGSMGNDYGTQKGEGFDFSTYSLTERYAHVINCGIDQMGAPGASATEEATLAAGGPGVIWVDGIINAVNEGLITEERLDDSARRLLKNKFELGIFDDPYCDGMVALRLSASDAYYTEKWDITDNESLAAARNPEEVELERQLMAESTVLVKNDNALLPLAEGTKVYVEASSSAVKNAYAKYLANYGVVVDSIEDCDVAIGDFGSFNDTAEQFIDDAIDAGVKIVYSCNNSDPNAAIMEAADAVLFVNFSRTADHGTGIQGIISTIEGDIFAELIFGVREPAGMIVKEISRNSLMETDQWKDLAGDMGVNPWVRLILEATMMTSDTYTVPFNWSDALLPYTFGMHYGAEADFSVNCLIVPQSYQEVTKQNGSSTTTSMEMVNSAKAGEPFTVYALIWNAGDDGIAVVQATVNGEVAAEKMMAVTDNSWRIVSMDIVIDAAGEYTITIGNASATIAIAE